MRKQYHLRKDEHGVLLAWDVDNLIKLTKNLKEEDILIDSIKEIDEPFWYDFGEIPTCKSIANHIKLINECSLEYPIILSDDKKVIDGMHRVLKAYLNEQKSIKAYILKTLPKPDFIDIKIENLPY